MALDIDIAIIGAGPYGLSLAAHLNQQRISTRVFGTPMKLWCDHMPKGMHLKSDGFASNLYDPDNVYTLKRFCSDQGLAYDDTSVPVPLDVFISYGVAFQKRFVPNLQQNDVVGLRQSTGHFELMLDNDEIIKASRVVIAVGVRSFRNLPACFEHLGPQFVTHSSDHDNLQSFSNHDVIVFGAGSSAVDSAALLNEVGAKVQLVSRKPVVRIHAGGPTQERPLWQRVRHPSSGIGPGLRHRIYCEAPWLFHRLPEKLRLSIVRRTLGPASGWFMRERVIGKIPFLLGFDLETAEIRNDRVQLRLRGMDGSARELVTDHVISATGYKIDVRRLDFLDSEIRSRIHTVENTPILSSSMEASVPGLYFTGPVAANSFGPVMRFAFGAKFATPHLTKALVKSVLRNSVPTFGMNAQPRGEQI
jgi:thioredoxin reductase